MTQASETLDLIERLRASGDDFCVATVIRTADLTSAKAGAKAVVTKDGDIHGFVGGGCVTGAVRKAALRAMEAGRPEMIRIRPTDQVETDVDADGAPLFKSACPSGGTVEIFLEPTGSARRILICGASPVAQALVAIIRVLGYRVTVAALTEDHGKIGGAGDYVAGFNLAATRLTPADAVVVATQGKRDREALKAALGTPAGYVSMVGSRRKIAALRDALAAEKTIPAERLGQLKGPAGFDVGAVGPEEIALSIAVEIVAFMRRSDTRTVANSRGATP